MNHKTYDKTPLAERPDLAALSAHAEHTLSAARTAETAAGHAASQYYMTGVSEEAVQLIVERILSTPQEQAYILLATGGFCPVHSGHLQMMYDVRDALTAQVGANVVAAFLSPSHDSYVQGKRQVIISHTVRCELIEAGDSDRRSARFVFADSWECDQPDFQSFGVVAEALLERLRDVAARHGVPVPIVCFVAGADNAGFAMCFVDKQEMGCAIVSRPGYGQLDCSDPENRIYSVEGSNIQISSSDLLRLVGEGAQADQLHELCPPSVAHWLVHESPYKPDFSESGAAPEFSTH